MGAARRALAAGGAVAAIAALALGLAGCPRKWNEAKRVWLGPERACATYSNGETACWGGDHLVPTAIATKGVVPDGAKIEDVALRPKAEPCFLTDTGVVACGAPGASWVPVGHGAIELVSGGGRACALARGEGVTCWTKGKSDVAKVAPLEPLRARIEHVAVHGAKVCASLSGAGGVRCFEGDAPRESVLAGAEVKALAMGAAHACAMLADRSVHCWGKNDVGQLGDGSTRDSMTEAVPVKRLGGALQLEAGDRHTCARLVNETVSCWGANDRHQLADGNTAPSSVPVPLFNVVKVVELAVAGDSGCVRFVREGELRCWGKNDAGQLGDGSREDHDVPMAVRSPK